MSEIWFINQYAITPDLPGGTRHYDLSVELVKSGHTVRIFASNVNLALRRHIRSLKGKLWLEELVNGISFVWNKTSLHQRNGWRRGIGMLNFSYNVYRAGLQQGVLPDLIIGSSPQPFAALAGYYLARQLGCRFILEVRDLWPQALIDMKEIHPQHPIIWIMRCVEQYLYYHADHIIVLAQGAISYLQEKGVSANRITYIPNGVHPDHFIPRRTRQEVRQLHGFNGFTLLYTGAHGPANALYTILDAANQLKGEPGIEFILVGDGPLKPRLQAQAHRLKLNNLRFLDPVPKNEIPDLLHAADAGIITLKDARAFYNAVSPNKFIDYLATGLPILCAAPGDVARMVEQCGCGLVSAPEDSTSMAKQIMQLATLPAGKRAEMGSKAHELVMEQFFIPNLAHKLLALI
jgi:glycosyltransferase involved in cell wall biosynthesis